MAVVGKGSATARLLHIVSSGCVLTFFLLSTTEIIFLENNIKELFSFPYQQQQIFS